MCDTGYIRMSYAQLQRVRLVHLVSGVDEDEPAGGAGHATSTAIGGYTEWVSQGGLMITVGWDWQMLPQRGCALARASPPSSNLMLQGPAGDDLGPRKTAILLENFIDNFSWQSEALQYINIRYSN